MGNKTCTQTSLQQGQCLPITSWVSLFFHEISCSTCNKFILRQHNCRMNPCKSKNSPNVNIRKFTKFKINIQAQI